MLASLDGAISIGGKSAGLSNATDRAVLLALRSAAGLVLVGAGTVRAESYNVPADPNVTIAVVTNSCSLDWDSEFVRSPQTIIVTHERGDVADGIETVRCGANSVDLSQVIDALGERVRQHGFIHVEGGPVLNGALLDCDVVDAFNLTIAPFTVGGEGSRATSGTIEMTTAFSLEHALSDGSHLFTRWVRTVPAS